MERSIPKPAYFAYTRGVHYTGPH